MNPISASCIKLDLNGLTRPAFSGDLDRKGLWALPGQWSPAASGILHGAGATAWLLTFAQTEQKPAASDP